MISKYTTYQLLQMMTDEDFNYMLENDPYYINAMCISLTLELAPLEKKQLLN